MKKSERLNIEITKEEFEDLYFNKRLTIKEIGETKNINYSRARYHMKLYNIPRHKDVHNLKCMSGQKFGRLTVIERVANKPNSSMARWLCKCDCGNEVTVNGGGLRYRRTNSCGCYKDEITFKGYNTLSKMYWNQVINRAKRKNMLLEITIEQAWEQWEKQNGRCALTGQELSLLRSYSNKQTASLDRIDNNKGYTKDNIQWVHKEINMMKHSRSNSRFIELCIQVAEYNRGVKNV